MKKALLGTTALIAGGLVAGSVMAADLEPAPVPAPIDEGWEVSVGGSAFAGFFYASNNNNSVITGTGYDDQALVPWLSEIWVVASTTLANGIQVGARVEFEGFSTNNSTPGATLGTGQGDDQVDEHFIWLQGNFGRLQLGANDSASDSLAILGPGYGALGINGPSFFAIPGNFSPVTGIIFATDSARKDMSGDANNITYFTPRISGFQAAVSYIPNNTDGGGGMFLGVPTAMFGVEENIFSIGANYINTFNDITLALGGGYETGNTIGAGRRNVWHVGARVGMAGFTVGGHYSRDNNPGTIFGATQRDTVWQVSGTYGQGPWTVGAGYLDSERDNGLGFAGLNGTYRRVGGGGTYSLGTGVTLTADVNWERRTLNLAPVWNAKGVLAGVGIATAF